MPSRSRVQPASVGVLRRQGRRGAYRSKRKWVARTPPSFSTMPTSTSPWSRYCWAPSARRDKVHRHVSAGAHRGHRGCVPVVAQGSRGRAGCRRSHRRRHPDGPGGQRVRVRHDHRGDRRRGRTGCGHPCRWARLQGRPLAAGYFIAPTIMELGMGAVDLWTEELFGPVLAVRRAADTEEAFRLANDSEYGLSAAIFTKTSPGPYRRSTTWTWASCM